MKIYECDGTYPRSPDEKNFIINIEDIYIGYAFKYKNTYYSINRINRAAGFAAAKKLKIHEKGREHLYTRNIMCPFCGYEDYDSGEMLNEDGECECGACGSIFSYQRDIEVSYCSKPVKLNDIDIIKE
jgi:hypothetical protein